MASCVVGGRAGLSELVDDFVQRKDIQDLMRKVVVIADDDEDPNAPGYSPFDLVTVVLKDGRKIESRKIDTVRGGPAFPLSRDQLWAKFEDCANVGHANAIARPLFDAMMSLEKVGKVNEVPGLG